MASLYYPCWQVDVQVKETVYKANPLMQDKHFVSLEQVLQGETHLRH